MLVPSPRCILNCQSLSVHLPPLPDSRDHSSRDKYLSPPMSASPKNSRFVNSPPQHPNYHRQYSLSPESARSTSSKPSAAQSRDPQNVKARPPRLQREPSTPTGNAEIQPPRSSLHLTRDARMLREGSNDELSSTTQDSPEAQHLTAGTPGIARRAKAHVPSACVNCKRKHLACETRRPCNRCVQTGKEVRESWIRSTFLILINSSQLASTCSIRNGVDPDYGRKKARGKWISGANIPIRRFIRTDMVYSPFHRSAVGDQNPIESCDLSLAFITMISRKDRLILNMPLNSISQARQEFRSRRRRPTCQTALRLCS